MAGARGCLGLVLVACSSGECGRSSKEGSKASDVASVESIASVAPSADASSARARAADPTLLSMALKIETGDHRDACDERMREHRRKVATAIDRQWPAIEARGASLAEAPPYRRTRLGPTYVRERDLKPRTPESHAWATVQRSWATLVATLATLPLDSDGAAIDEGWVNLARDARALLSFDLARAVAGTWRDAARASLPPHVLSPNPGVARDGSVLTVLLDPGTLDGEKVRLARIIEGAWTSRPLAVHVRWTSQSSEPRAHRLVTSRVAGEPSYVSDRLRQVHLAPDMPALAIAHEVGHVLGFSDRYAKTYEPTRCSYVEERHSGDIMSDSEGAVSKEHWTLLADAYRNAAPPNRVAPKP